MASTDSEHGDQVLNTAYDAAKLLLREIRTIREAGTLAGHLTDGKKWLDATARLKSHLPEARGRIEPLLSQLQAATTNIGPVQCGHLAAPTAHELVLKLSEHAMKMVEMATVQSLRRHETEGNAYQCAVELAREIGVPPIEVWSLLEARLQCEAQSTVPITGTAYNGARQSRGARGVKPKRPATVNQRMAETILEDPRAMAWNSTEWAKHLKCAKSTVVGTPTWKWLEKARQDAKAERMTDRRMKPKASDSRRD